MAGVVAFLQRPYAATYARACERYGVDPAAALDDDYLAAQYRVGAAVVATREEREQTPEATTDPFAVAREAGAKVKAAVGQ